MLQVSQSYSVCIDIEQGLSKPYSLYYIIYTSCYVASSQEGCGVCPPFRPLYEALCNETMKIHALYM